MQAFLQSVGTKKLSPEQRVQSRLVSPRLLKQPGRRVCDGKAAFGTERKSQKESKQNLLSRNGEIREESRDKQSGGSDQGGVIREEGLIYSFLDTFIKGAKGNHVAQTASGVVQLV